MPTPPLTTRAPDAQLVELVVLLIRVLEVIFTGEAGHAVIVSRYVMPPVLEFPSTRELP